VKDLIWDNTLSVEVDEIDEDHRRLVDLFNILAHSVSENDSPEYIAAVLEELISCTVWHFRHEERLMIKYGYDGYADHREEHQDLIESAQALQGKFQQNEKRLSAEEVEFLEHWLTGHILAADMKLGAFLVDAM
jgi:hemerythrin